MTGHLTRAQARALVAQHERATSLTVDARNRALRTFLQGLAWDLLTAVAVVVYTVAATGGDAIAWGVLGAAIVKTLLTTVASYVMRAKLDPSGIPTPLPPASAGPPADPIPAASRAELEQQPVVDDEPATDVQGFAAQHLGPPTSLIPGRIPYGGFTPQQPDVADHADDGPRSEAARQARLNEPE